MKIYLVRHGKLKWEDNIKKCIGITDIELNLEGIQIAEGNGKVLKDKNISKIYSSDLKRCEKTAQVISQIIEKPYELKEDLREINMGVWENKSFEYIKEKYPKDYEKRGENIDTFKVENGESFEECYKRAVEILKKLSNENKDKNIVLVSHSGIIRCLICYIKKIPLKDIKSIKLDYGEMITIDYYNEKYKICK